MSKKKEKDICLDPSQTRRLINDTVKIAKGLDDDDICPTVQEMYDDNVDDDLKEYKPEKKGREKKDVFEKGIDKLGRKATRKAKSFFGAVGELF